ncbi:neuronal calcium sensor 1-like [Penaeus monodon]|uniref:neuronal calcium sensor 1-like n=1 Tax=Penaeus monodon TaxID=6687 RepID=UPI0018A77C33|nr:neuronal calcium sensor 1-like [Penaeus monodon]
MKKVNEKRGIRIGASAYIIAGTSHCVYSVNSKLKAIAFLCAPTTDRNNFRRVIAIIAIEAAINCLCYQSPGQKVEEDKDDMDDFSLHVQRYRPEELDKLAKTTKFSRKEIQLIYRGFKQECPTGLIDEEGFKGIFSQFFPLGDATHYAHYVFNTFTQNNQGQISFEDFLAALSTVSRGSTQEKLQWIFGLYDVNNDGLITKTEMVDVVTAIYEMMGRSTEPQVEETSAKEHVEKIFHLIDTNQDGAITIEELAEWVSRDDTIIQSLSMMDTVLYTRRDRGADGAPPPTRPSLSQP